jgi:hypothetical protein
MSCGEEVKAGQDYVILNIWGGSDPLHLECYVADHPDVCVLGVKTTKTYYYGLTRNAVICKDFAKNDNQGNNSKS